VRPPIRKHPPGRVEAIWARLTRTADPWGARAFDLAGGNPLVASEILRSMTRPEIAWALRLKLATSEFGWDDADA